MRWTLACLFLTGCLVDFNYTGSQFLCPDNVCPDGFDCRSGECVESSVPAADASPDGAADASADAAPVICPVDCPVVPGTRLCYCEADIDWAAARDSCETMGTSLARIDDANTAQALRTFLAGAGADVRTWLGGTDEVVEGEWRWLDGDDLFWTGLADGSAPAGVVTDWNLGEPNQFMGNEEDCLQAWSVGWNDARCLETRSFVCGEVTP